MTKTGNNNSTAASTFVAEQPKLKLANPLEKNKFEMTNPFGDFSGFESNIEKMQPIIPDLQT